MFGVRLGPDRDPETLRQAARSEDDQAGLRELLADTAEDVDLEGQIVLRLEQADGQEQRSVCRKEVEETLRKRRRRPGLGNGEGRDQPHPVGIEAELVEEPSDRTIHRDHAVEASEDEPAQRRGARRPPRA